MTNKPALSRRQFLKGAGTAAMAAGVATIASGCAEPTPQPEQSPLPHSLPIYLQYPGVPVAPVDVPAHGTLRFFSLHEARTVEAFTARLLPGTPDDPGAREAGVVNYIDHMLSYPDGFGETIYRKPPFVQLYEGEAPPADARNGSFEVIWVAADQIERYGYQSPLTPREVYRLGLAGLDGFANQRFQQNFVDLSEAQQDELVGAMADGQATGFMHMSGEQFFHVLRRHTMEGMFSDPAYGGNRDYVGWKLIGYPGAQRAYTVAELQGQIEPRRPQGLHELNHFNPGQEGREGVVLPLSGSNPNTWTEAHDAPGRMNHDQGR